MLVQNRPSLQISLFLVKYTCFRACTGFDGDDAALEAIRKKSR